MISAAVWISFWVYETVRDRDDGEFRAPYGAVTWRIFGGDAYGPDVNVPGLPVFTLGGQQKGPARKYLNIMLVFLFCGMWHGAGITFLIWGFLNGAYQVAGSMTVRLRERLCQAAGLDGHSHGAMLRKKLTTAVLIESTWLFFRADGFKEAFVMLRRMFTGWNPWILSDGTLYQAGLDQWDFLILLVGALCVGRVSRMADDKDLYRIFCSQSWLCQIMVILGALVVWYLFGIYGPGI